MNKTIVVFAFFIASFSLVSIAVSEDAEPQGPSLQKSLNDLVVRKGYEVVCVAHEPLVHDPVSARFDTKGRLWIVEMPDYPNGPIEGAKASGRIKVLHDDDKDGVFDRFVVFADQLLIPTGVQPYKNGAFVTLAHQVVFFEDTDGDLVSDKQEILFDGFTAANEQLRANHPTLGPDGWIYVAGGLRGGKVRAVSARYRKQDPVDLRDRDFAFDPEGEHWKAVAGKSQFGLTIDDFDRRIGCSNRNPAMTTPLTLEAVNRDPLLAPRDAIVDVGLSAEQSRVHSIAKAWTTSNLHAGQFSAACGVCAPGLYSSQETEVGPQRSEWLYVCEPTSHVVQRQQIGAHGSVWRSVREPEEAEFLASRNTWFRPVDLTVGQNDQLYVVDMARAVIEHPDFMPIELKTRGDLTYGKSLGRVWCVRSINPPKQNSKGQLRHSEMTDSAAAIHRLQSDESWDRVAGSQYFLENGISGHEDTLRNLINDHDAAPATKSRAAFLLTRFNKLSSRDVEVLSENTSFRLRALAVKLTQTLLSKQHVHQLVNDSAPHVLRAFADYLAESKRFKPSVPMQAIDASFRSTMLTRVSENPAANDLWIRRAITSCDDALVERLAEQLADSDRPNDEMMSHLVERVAIVNAELAVSLVDKLSKKPRIEPEQLAKYMRATVDGCKRSGQSLAEKKDLFPAQLQQATVEIVSSLNKTALDASANSQARSACIATSGAIERPPSSFRSLLNDNAPTEVQAAAAEVLFRYDAKWMQSLFASRHQSMTPAVKETSLQAMTRSTESTRWLLHQISHERIPRSIVPPSLAIRLQKHRDHEIREAAVKLFASDPDRLAIIKQYQNAAVNLGDPEHGKALFKQHCSACHRIDSFGTNVGPDISDCRTKTPASLLVSILDPNAAIDASFVQYNVLTVDGQIFDGLLIDESSETITLKRKGGEREIISRDSIEELQTPGISLMPQGFEQQIDVAHMADLIAYLKYWRYEGSGIPVNLSRHK